MKTKLIPLKVRSNEFLTDEYFSVVFDKPKGFVFNCGECFNLKFENGDGRIFSFSSSPTENDLVVTAKKGLSDFKNKLENTKAGDTLLVDLIGTSYTFSSKNRMVFIAGGIGIAVFRSVLKYFVDKKQKPDITLIYLNSTNDFPFKKELEEWKKLLNLKIFYIETEKEGRLTEEKLKNLIPDVNSEHYVIGPPLMVDATVELLESLKVKKVHTDSFDGYNELI